MNKIKWTQKAIKQIDRLPEKDQVSIFRAVNTLEDMPHVRNVRALTNHRYDYRLRIGNYRVLFDFHGHVEIIEIQEVKKRDDRTY